MGYLPGSLYFIYLGNTFSHLALKAFFKYGISFLILWLATFLWPVKIMAQSQNFEANFLPLSYPSEFLPGWYGNEVRESASRIFQANGLGRGNSRALAVQPISTFNGQIWVRLNLNQDARKKVVFWARSAQNGTGNRPALVFYSWGKGLAGEFVGRAPLGGDFGFGNENQEFRKFTLEVPGIFAEEEEIFLKLEINYGPGTGSAARWIMDDFFFGEVESDFRPPKISGLKGYRKNELWLQFDEKVDPVFSLLPPSYELGDSAPEKIIRKNDSTLVLTFERSFEEAKEYSLKVSKVLDLEGNSIRDTTVIFQFYDPTAYGYKSLVINELMPAPRADQDLPNVEFVELFNPTKKEYRLDLLKLGNSRSETGLSEQWIGPESYLILVPKGQENLIRVFEKVVGVANWPTLLNSGDQVVLKSQNGLMLDQISFSTGTWGGSEFSGGGYSLEVPNPYFLCDNSTFLQASKDPVRGTPGRVNSVYNPILSTPEVRLRQAYFVDSMSFLVELEGVISGEIYPEQVEINPKLDLAKVDKVSSTHYRVFLKTPAIPNQLYQVFLHGLGDCIGQKIEHLGPSPLVLASVPKPGEIHLTEILFDPISGDPKFVEIHNSSQNYLSLKGWSLGNMNDQGQVGQIRVFGTEGLIIPPIGFLALSTDSEKLRLRYPKSRDGIFFQVTSLPSYPISGGTVVLLRNDKDVVEKFSYSSKYHHPLVQNSKGVSLERISIKNGVEEISNWQSASGNEDFATPGRKNSQFLDGEIQDEIFSIEPRVFDPEGSIGPAFTTISYEFDQAGWVGTITIFSASGQPAKVLCQNQVLGTKGLFTWNGLDESGGRVKPGYYVLLAEIYDLEGNVKVIKKTMVVAVKL